MSFYNGDPLPGSVETLTFLGLQESLWVYCLFTLINPITVLFFWLLSNFLCTYFDSSVQNTWMLCSSRLWLGSTLETASRIFQVAWYLILEFVGSPFNVLSTLGSELYSFIQRKTKDPFFPTQEECLNKNINYPVLMQTVVWFLISAFMSVCDLSLTLLQLFNFCPLFKIY